jgi:hypothetical protein
MGTPRSPPTRVMAIPDKWIRPNRRPADLSVGLTNIVGGPHDLLQTLQKILQTTLFKTTSGLGVQDKTLVDFDQSRSMDNGNHCNQLDLGLLIVTDQESGNRPHPLAKIRQVRRPLYHTESSSNLHQQLHVGFYSPEARTSINSLSSLCSLCSCATFEFLALNSTSMNN